jgi:CDP-diacylglycerol---serine O-phosphatidyltransferase
MRNRMAFIPSLFTVLNLFCGFLSIINASAGNIEAASMFIIYAGLFDAFDGVVARFTGTSSKFGVELDSLADMVSFGAAPSFILYKAYFYHLDGLGIAVASLVMIFAALRLARFNTQLVGFDKNYFTGVPAPLAALTISSFFLFYFNINFNTGTSAIFAFILALLLPALMLSKFRYDTTPKLSGREVKKHPVKFIIIFLVIVLIVVTRGDGLFAFCLFYLSTGIFRGIRNKTSKMIGRKKGGELTPEEKLDLKSNS